MSSSAHSRPGRAAIVGGSLGGLFAANLLHRAGWDVAVFERTPDELSGRGAGIVTHPELFEVLAMCGVAIERDIGVEVPGRVVLAGDGHVVAERPLPQILTGWSRLYHLLRQALPADCYRSGKSLQGIEQSDEKVTSIFSDGSRESSDILIGADGFRSTVRGLFRPEIRPVYAGYVAWRGMAEEARLSAATRSALFERFAFCLPPGEQMLGYPVAGAADSIEPGRRRFNFVWYRPADEETELPRLLTDDSGTLHQGGIPPGLISRAVLAEMFDAADRSLAPQFAEIVHKTPQPFFQPIYDLEAPELVFGRVVLLGDAAFVARPHCGMGVTKAGSDARVLTEALRALPIDKALRRYEAERVRVGHFIVNHARHLGAYMQAQIRTQEEREMAERYRTPDAVMRETAVALAYNP